VKAKITTNVPVITNNYACPKCRLVMTLIDDDDDDYHDFHDVDDNNNDDDTFTLQ
jgi:hypothetical protein